MTSITEELETTERLSRDLKRAAEDVGTDEARFMVSAYYQLQKMRKGTGNQLRALVEAESPHEIIDWVHENTRRVERALVVALDHYSDSHEVGRWSKSIRGIGPIIAAGLLAHIDITKAPTAGALWRFAGLDPAVQWDKGQKRPWNADLKTLCWNLGKSFVYQSNREDSLYGPVYQKRKVLEQERNERGDFASQAAVKLKKFKIGKDTDAYKWYIQGKLPPAHIQQRAERVAVKLFLSHWHHVMWEITYGEPPAVPYAFAVLQHDDRHYIEPPNWPMESDD